nr:alcohol dehydrogenase catalytic domain-containing protein [Lactiplantibacillus plantarum]
MLNQVYRLVSPRQFEVETVAEEVDADDLIVRPKFLSICHADTRYFFGQRSQAALRAKLPMALIHEAVGEVVYDPRNEYKPGTLVAMVPNTPVKKDSIIQEIIYLLQDSVQAATTALCKNMFVYDATAQSPCQATSIHTWPHSLRWSRSAFKH